MPENAIIPLDTRTEILRRIRSAEQEHDVRVLYAIESGSRAWGFASQNSDFDVRFVYVRPKEWYLSVDLEDRRDVIEYPIVDEIDINGWDIRKALKLFWKSNPTIIEWLQSPIMYIDDGVFSPAARSLIPDIYSIEKGIYHYRSMAKTNYRGYLKADRVPLKKYFYVLRPLLSIMWLEKKRLPAPTEFLTLRALVENNTVLDREISYLLARKIASQEKEIAASIPVIDAFIESELERLESLTLDSTRKDCSFDSLNTLMLQILDQH
ncbi:MAG: putative nucleotidyltransferase [Flavobacteriales bacterium]|jgi:predicted nucleotidyltransferase